MQELQEDIQWVRDYIPVVLRSSCTNVIQLSYQNTDGT